MRRPTDWSGVRRAVFAVRHSYRYDYAAPVTDLKQRLVMVPPDRHGDQALLSHELTVTGTADGFAQGWEADEFGNRVARVTAPRVDEAVEFAVRYRVERTAGAVLDLAERLGLRRDLDRYLHPTARTAPDEALRAAADEIAARSGDPRQRAELAHDWAARAITYQFGVTGVQTPAAMALHLGRGVCQDYAQIMLAVLRLLGVPARYVSGHLLGEGAPHAWVEALFAADAAPGGVDVVAYDPTHHRRVGLNYLTVAVGRDYGDVSPTSGFFTGPSAGRLSTAKAADLVVLEWANGAREEAIA